MSTSERHSPGPPRGILRAAQPFAPTEHRRVAPSESLAGVIAHYWWVRWDLGDGAPVQVETLPHPCVHVVFEGARAEVTGVHTRRFTRSLSGSGRAFGIKLRPAAFSALYEGRVATLAERVVPVTDALGQLGVELATHVTPELPLADCIACADALLSSVTPSLTDVVQRLRDLVERMEHDRHLVRVEHAAEAFGVPIRTLQRLFQRHVGASPKWVLSRYRLMEAAERLDRGDSPPLAQLAAELGYADQAHFVRDFKAVVGRGPGAYATGRREP